MGIDHNLVDEPTVISESVIGVVDDTRDVFEPWELSEVYGRHVIILPPTPVQREGGLGVQTGN